VALACALTLLAALRSWAPPPLAYAGGTPGPPEMLQALGRELWVAGDELLIVSTRMKGGGQMANAALSLRNAADMMLDGDWENVQGELESASVSAMDYLPEECFTGLVDLFGYTEPMPVIEWGNARDSLLSLSATLRAQRVEIMRNLEGLYRSETEASLVVVAESLQKASGLFTAGGFYMPDDPRSDEARAGKGASRTPEGPWGDDPQEAARAFEKKLQGEGILVEARNAAARTGGEAPGVLADVEAQLRQAAETQARRRLLRRLIRELHPDQNPERTEDVLPAFRYVQRLREQD